MRNKIMTMISAAGRVALPALIVVLALSTLDTRPTMATTHVPGATPAGDAVPITYMTPTPPDATAEGEPGWDCRRHGNGVCGEDNPGGYAAGCYVRTGKRAGTLLTPWDERMRQELFTGAYRPARCGRLTLRDRQMARRLDGSIGQLCANNRTGGATCWFADQSRPADADGAPWDPAVHA